MSSPPPPPPSSSPDPDTTNKPAFSFTSSSSFSPFALPPQLEDQLKVIFGALCKQQVLLEVEKLKSAVQREDTEAIAMALPMLLAITVCPAMLGTQEAIRQSQSKTKREEHRSRRCNLIVSCVKPSIRSRDINNKLIVLKDNKLFIANEHPLYNHDRSNSVSRGYPFSGYFLPYPDAKYEGLVSTISDDPPQLNWIYIDKNTYEVKYGLRVEAQPHLTGPFDCTKQDRRMNFENWEGFLAVEELPGIWALYFDRDDDGLKSKVPMGTRVLEVELTRREKKERKPEPDPDQPMTMDDKMKQHKEQTAREEKEHAAFVATGDPNHAPAPPPAHVADAASEKTDMLIKAMDRISLRRKTEDETHETQSHHSHAPSTTTADFSMWSGAHKPRRNREGEDAHSSGSVTAASSVWDQAEAEASLMGEETEGEAYKKPYVEDDAAPAA